MTKRILIMGLPGAGKTTFAQALVERLQPTHSVQWFNADQVRQDHNDWNFTPAGRLRQVQRMRDLADKSNSDYAICDFVCPTEEYRSVFDADIVIWMDTIPKGRFEDTNKLFVAPTTYTHRITDWSPNWIDTIITSL